MNKRKIWQVPLLRREGDENKHRPVTWLELFFDLFFVVVIGSLTQELSVDISVPGIKNFAMGFIPIWWIWIGSTIYNERFETDGIEIRIFTFLLMIPVAGMAIFSHDLTGEYLKSFLLCYAFARVIIIYLWARAGYYNKLFRPTSNIYVIGFSISVILVVTSAFLESYISSILFPLALIIDLHTPFFTIRHQRKLPRFTTSKLPERYGLFTIIVLGEIVVGIIGGLTKYHHLDFPVIPLGISAIATAVGFWWLYFDFIARRPFHRNVFITIMWSYVHMPLVMSFVLTGAELNNLISVARHPGQNAITIYLITIGLALLLIGLLELTLERGEKEPTHPVFSPGLKFVTGIIGIYSGMSGFFHSPQMAILVGIILILINIFYGTYVWFNQNPENISVS